MAIGVEYRVIQDVGGSAKLHNNEVQRLASPPSSGRASFILPPSARYTSRVFKVIVPCAKDAPPEIEFLPRGSEQTRIVADESRGGFAALLPATGDNAYVFHEISPGVFMVYREVAGAEGEEGMEIIKYGTIDEEGNLTVSPSVETEGSSITFGPHDGYPIGDREAPVDPPEGYHYEKTGLYELDESSKWLLPTYELVPDTPVPPPVPPIPVVVGDAVRKPFGIYDIGSSDEGGSGFPDIEMYLPAHSLCADGRPIPIDGIEGDTMPITAPGVFWCVVLARPSNPPDTGSSSSSEDFPDQPGVTSADGSDFFALVVDSDGKSELKDKTLFSFKIGEVSEEGEITQVAFGSVVLSHLDDFSRLVPFQLCTTTYRDEQHTLTVYRLFTPENATVQYNGSFLPVAEADGNWTDLDVDDETEGVYSFVCAIADRVAHIVRREDAEQYVGNPDSPAVFPVADIVVGDESHVVPGFSGAVSAVVVSVEHSAIERDLIGAGITGASWAERLRRLTSDVVVLSDNAATSAAVKSAFRKACETEGLAVLVIAAHGGCDDSHNNIVALYDALVSDAEVWAIASTAKGRVWLVFDCCHSESMYAAGKPFPSDVPTLAASIARLAAGSDSEVPVLCWAGATDSTVGWYSSGTGGFFSQSCLRNTANGETFAAAWEKVKTDPALLQWQTPACTVIHDFPTQDIPFSAPDISGESSN